MSTLRPKPSNSIMNGTSKASQSKTPSTRGLATTEVKVGAAGVQPVSVLKNNNVDSNTVVAMWDLAPPRVKHAIESTELKTEFLQFKNQEQTEAIMQGNTELGRHRRLVNIKDYASGGKYRAIVKLVMTYKSSPDSRFIGTGWLVNRDLIATAGHNAFSWPSGSRTQSAELVEVEAYIGYQGAKTLQADIRSGQVQYRRVVTVATTMQYLARKDQRQFDAAFFKVEKPFEGVEPLTWRNTPLTGNMNIGIVGYPGDKTDGGQNGARMYEMFIPTKFNLKTAKLGMLEYQVDTYGGNSGGPVLSVDGSGKIVSIGVHTYGGAESNSGTVIGRYGVPFIDYIAAFSLRDTTKPPPKTLPYAWKGLGSISIPLSPESYDVNIFQAPTTGSKIKDPFKESTEATFGPGIRQESDEEAEEEFWGSILRGAGTLLTKIPKDVLTSGAGSLAKRFGLGSNIGNLVGAGAHMAIMAAGRKLSSTESFDAESTPLTDGLAARAILAQAALETVYRLGDLDEREELTDQVQLRDAIIADMRVTFPQLKPFYKRAGLAVAPIVRDLTLRAALSQANQSELPPSLSYPKESAEDAESGVLDSEDGQEFSELLQSTARSQAENGSMQESDEEFFGSLLNIIKRGTKIILPIASSAIGGPFGTLIGKGISTLVNALPESVDANSGIAAVTGLLPIEDGAWKQAALAEAALLAIMKQSGTLLESTGSLGFMTRIIRISGPGIIASEGIVKVAVPPVLEDVVNKPSFDPVLRPAVMPKPPSAPIPGEDTPPGLYAYRMWQRRARYGAFGGNLSIEARAEQTDANQVNSSFSQVTMETTVTTTRDFTSAESKDQEVSQNGFDSGD